MAIFCVPLFACCLLLSLPLVYEGAQSGIFFQERFSKISASASKIDRAFLKRVFHTISQCFAYLVLFITFTLSQLIDQAFVLGKNYK